MTFVVFSLIDHKYIYRQRVKGREEVTTLMFDQDNSIIYFVGKDGIYRTDILWQMQDLNISLGHNIAFNNMDGQTPLSQYMMDLGTYQSFPQMQNLLHLFAIMDMGDHLAEALEDKLLIYLTDSNGQSPLMLASEA